MRPSRAACWASCCTSGHVLPLLPAPAAMPTAGAGATISVSGGGAVDERIERWWSGGEFGAKDCAEEKIRDGIPWVFAAEELSDDRQTLHRIVAVSRFGRNRTLLRGRRASPTCFGFHGFGGFF